MFDIIGRYALFPLAHDWPGGYLYFQWKKLTGGQIIPTSDNNPGNFYTQDGKCRLNAETIKKNYEVENFKVKYEADVLTFNANNVKSDALLLKAKKQQLNHDNSRPLIVYSPGNCNSIRDSMSFVYNIRQKSQRSKALCQRKEYVHPDFLLADYTLHLVQHRLKNKQITQPAAIDYCQQVVKSAFEKHTSDNQPLVFCCYSTGGLVLLHAIANYLDQMAANNNGSLPEDIQKKVDNMKIITCNVPSQGEQKGELLFFRSLRKKYAHFMLSREFRKHNTANACERILSYVNKKNKKNKKSLLVLQVDDDNVVDSNMQLYNEIKPLKEKYRNSRKDKECLVNRAMFKSTRPGNDEHHIIPWHEMKLWNHGSHRDNRNVNQVINDFIYLDSVPSQDQHDFSESEHRKIEKEEDKRSKKTLR